MGLVFGYWLANWGWHKVLPEPSVFWISTDSGNALIEVGSDDFIVTAPDDATHGKLAEAFIAVWNTIAELTAETPMETPTRIVKHADADQNAHLDHNQPSTTSTPYKLVLQHVGLKIAKTSDGSVKEQP